MPGKKRNGRKKRTQGLRNASIGRKSFAWLGKALFLFVFLAFIYIGLTSNIVLVAALAGIAIFLWGAVALPTDEFQEAGRYLWDGDFGRDLHEWWNRALPWRDRRGSARMDALLPLLVVALLVVSLVALPMASGVAAGQSDGDSDDGFQTTHNCATTIHYTEFRTHDGTVESLNESGVATVTKKNTRVRVNETQAFWRVKAKNPNTYCVEMTVEISDEVMPLANLGEVESIDGKTTALWTDVYSFENQSGYTDLTFTVPANASVTFAPSKPTVFLPAWRDDRARDAKGVFDKVKNLNPFGEEKPLEKRVYKFHANESDSVTVRLDNPNADERIQDWNAVYRLDDNEPWKPVDTDTTEPVYYRKTSENRVEFVMDDPDATVEFTANPNTLDSMKHEIRSYKRSLTDITDLLPFVLQPSPVLQGEVV